MQNKYFKAAIISSSIAVATGVFLFGINATFGAPTYQPPGADVSPTFTGLNVTGPISNSGGALNLNDSATITGDATVTGNMDLQGTIRNSTNNNAQAVKIDDSLDVTGAIVNNSGVAGVNPVTIADSNGVNFFGPIFNSLGIFTINDIDGIDIRGPIRNTTAAPVVINDTEGVNIAAGDLDLQAGKIKNSTANNSGNVVVNDDLQVTGNTAVSGDTTVSGTVNTNLVKSIGDTLNLHGGTGVKVDGTLYASMISNTVPGDPVVITEENGLDVLGDIKSTSGAVKVNDPDGLSVLSGPLSVSTITAPGTLPVSITKGLKVTQTGGGAGTTKALTLTAGNDAGYYGNNQILFGYNGNDYYMHAIKSRHNANGKAGNALDFYVWDQGVDAAATSGVVGTKQVMTLDGNGNVGIGTTVPGSKLHVSGSDTFGNRMGLLIDNIATTGTHLASVTLKTAGINYGDIFGGAANLGFGLVNGITISPGVNDQDIGFRTGTQLAGGATGPSMIIKASGNVGIGTSTPSTALSVKGKITSTLGFGTITTRPSLAAVTVAPNTWGSASASCNATTVNNPAIGETLLSCSVWNSGYGYVNSIYPSALNPRTCNADFFNNGASNNSMKVYAVCLDPTI